MTYESSMTIAQVFERDCIKDVSALLRLFEASQGMYSRNEQADDIATSTVPYCLIPFYLGKAYEEGKCDGKEARKKDVTEAVKWFRFYAEIVLPVLLNDPDTRPVKINIASDERSRKIERLKEERFLQVPAEFFQAYFSKNLERDEEQARFTWFQHVKWTQLKTEDALKMLHAESKLLSTDQDEIKVETELPVFKPYVIYKDARQKAMESVFGPSHRLPSMTLDDYYEHILQPQIKTEEERKRLNNLANQVKLSEEQDEEKQRKELLARDELRDTVKRGSGNTINKS